MLSDGIHKGLPDDVYHPLERCSKHQLDILSKQSPKHLRYKLEHPDEPTPTLIFGAAFHSAILTPEAFAADWSIVSGCKAVLKTGKNAGQTCRNAGTHGGYCATHAPDGAEPSARQLTQAQADQIARMHDALLDHRAARAVLESEGDNEIAALWTDRIKGDDWEHDLLCKAKADALRPDWGAIVDIKTCESAAMEACERAIFDFGYHRQAAMYLDGFKAAGISFERFILLFVEKTAPYGVRACSLQADALELGRDEIAKLKRTYAACQRLNHWYGYEQDFTDISIPAWAMRKAFTK